MKMNGITRKLLALCMTVLMLASMAVPAFASELEGVQPPEGEGQNTEQQILPASDVPEHTHSHQAAVTTAATCTAEGVMTYTCACGDTYTAAIPMAEHIYGEATTVAPGCEAEGSMSASCTVCDFVNTQTVPATGHSYGEPVVTAASCTADGSRVYTCTVEGCGYVHTELIPATGHSYGEPVVTAASCTADGSRVCTCSVCGNVYTEVIPAAHTYGEPVVTPSACTTDGSRVYTCTVEGCGYVHTELIPAAHTYGEPVVADAACTVEGSRTYTCTVEGCGYVHTELIPATGHSYVDMVCSVCGTVQCCWQPDCLAAEHEVGCLKGSVDKVTALMAQLPLADTVTEENFEAVKALMDEIRAVDDAHRQAWLHTEYEMYVWNILQADANYVELYDIIANGVMMLEVADPAAKIGDVGYASVQEAINAAVNGADGTYTIVIQKDITENFDIPQVSVKNIILEGNGKSITGLVRIIGNSHYGVETLVIRNVNFTALSSEDSVILVPGDNVGRYAHNVTINNCTFNGAGQGAAAFRSETGGDKNINIISCSVGIGMHSLLQAANITGLEINGCTVNSKNGINLNSSSDVNISNNNISVTGYAVRTGVGSGGNADSESITLSNNTLASASESPIVLRTSSGNANISMSGNSVSAPSGIAHISGDNLTDTPAISANANYWGGSEPVVDGTTVEVQSYYTDEDRTNLTYPDAVAKVGDTPFASLADAIAAANGGTVTLLKPVTLTEKLSIGGSVILDLNGNTVTSAINDPYGAVYVGVSGNLTINDSSNPSTGGISNTAGTALGVYGTLTVNGGTFTGSEGYAALYNFYYDGSTYGKSTINGGSFNTVWNSGKLTVTGGSIDYLDNSGNSTIGESALVSEILAKDGSDASELTNKGTIVGAEGLNAVIKTEDGFEVEYADGKYTVSTRKVAEVNGTKYSTLKEAFEAAASSNGTVTLLEDIELTEGVTVPAGATVTLDLNGKVLSGNTNSASSSAVITNNGTLTIKDNAGNGKITAFAQNPDTAAVPSYANNTITNCGTLTLQSGTIENTTASGLACYPIDNNSTTRDAIVNIQGGTVTGRGAIRQFANSTTNRNEVSITGGTVSGTSYGVWVQNPSDGSTTNASDTKAKLSISGGSVSKVLLEPSAALEVSITGGSISEVALWEEETVNTSRNPSGFISGGSFISEDSVEADMLKPGYTLVANESGGFSPALTDPEAMIGETPYATLAEAVAEANASGGTVKVMKDVALTGPLTVTGSMVLDLNGNTVSYSSDIPGDAMLTNNGALTVQDSSAEGDGKFVYTYTGAADTSYGKGNYTIVNNGTLNVSSGTVENATAAMSHAYYAVQNFAGATLNVYGGNIINKTGHAVRMASFGAGANNVNVSGGYIEGTRAIMVQLPGSDSSSAPEYNLNISGGTLTSNETTYNLGVYIYSNGQSAANVKLGISGGTINGNVAINATATGTMAKDSARVTGGTINGEYGIFSYSDDDDTAAAVISITGGNFKNKNSEYYCYHDEGYAFVQNSDGSYSPMSINEAKIGDTPYTTFAEALEAAPEDSTIVLMRSVVYPDDLVISKNITIDPNGFSFGLAVGKLIKVDEGKVLTINLDYATYVEAFKALAPGLCVSEGSIKIQHHAVGTNGSAATCTSGPVCGYCGETFGAALGHSLVYTGSGSTITESCARSCGHSATAKLELDSSVSTAYTGSEIKPIKVVYSDKWIAAKDLTVTYKDNIAIGTDTATGTIQKANENSSEVATATLKFSITRASYTLTVNNYRYVRASGYPLSFTSNVPYDASNTVSKLLIVRANGTPVMVVPAAHFALSANSSGMTVITLSPTVMNALDALNYELQATFTNGDAKGAFRVLLPFIFPMTGDDAQTLLLLCLTFVALGTAAVTIFVIRKKSKGSRYNSKH